MSITLTDNEIQKVMHALALAEHDLSFLHGVRVTDIPDENTSWEVNNHETLQQISEAFALLDKPDNNRNPY